MIKEEMNHRVYLCTYKINEDNLYAFENIITNTTKADHSLFRFINKEISIYGDEVEVLKQAEKSRKIFKYNINYEEYCKFNYMKEPGDSGLELIDKVNLDLANKVVSTLLKTLGKNFLAGRDLTTITTPIFINDERSIMELLGSSLKHSLEYFIKAANTNDNIERLKIMTTYLVINMNQIVIPYKPFNPIIGETFQCRYKVDSNDENEEGLKFYCEQTSHHPPIFNFYGIHELFTISGYNEFSAVGSINSVTAKIKGTFNLKFKNGVFLTLKNADYVMEGILVGKKKINLNGNFVITDYTNSLISFIKINPKDEGFFKKLFANNNNFPDYFRGSIANKSDVTYDKSKDKYTVNNKELVKIEGEYSSYLNINDKLVWSNEKLNYSGCQMKQEFTLPSDSTLRDDILLYKDKKIIHAQFAKMHLEEKQRKDKALRHNKRKSKDIVKI